MKRLQKALRDVKRREAGMQKSQCFQGFSARYEKRQQAQISAHNPKVVGSNPSSATIARLAATYGAIRGAMEAYGKSHLRIACDTLTNQSHC